MNLMTQEDIAKNLINYSSSSSPNTLDKAKVFVANIISNHNFKPVYNQETRLNEYDYDAIETYSVMTFFDYWMGATQ